MGRASRRKKKWAHIYSAYDLAPRTCPVCRKTHDASTCVSLGGTTRRGLEDGDLSICSGCGGLLFAAGGGFRLATQEQFDELGPDLQRIVQQLCQQIGLWPRIQKGARVVALPPTLVQ